MQDTFTIQCINTTARLELTGPIHEGAADDICGYVARIHGLPLDVAILVYDITPHHWTAFFRELANEWRGWTGERTYESLEGHLHLACTMNWKGHVKIRVTLRDPTDSSDWRALVTLHTESGQLDRIAAHAAAFFGSP